MQVDRRIRQQILHELEGNVYTIKKDVSVGINQGQYFIRIPKRISEELQIHKGTLVEIALTKGPRSRKIELRIKNQEKLYQKPEKKEEESKNQKDKMWQTEY